MDNSTRIYKKYKNRHIYDLKLSAYVDLPEILSVVRSGEDIKVIDSSSGADITYRILVQGLLKLEQNNYPSSLDLINRVICSEGGSFTGYIRELESSRRIESHPLIYKLVRPVQPDNSRK